MNFIRRINTNEGALIRALRISALLDAPSAFGETIEEAKNKTKEQYEASAQLRANSDSDAFFVAEDSGRYVGMIGAFFENESGKPFISSMWVSPDKRRANTGAALFSIASIWLKARGAQEINAWVAIDNMIAIKFYERLGFVGSNIVEAIPADKTRDERIYVYVV